MKLDYFINNVISIVIYTVIILLFLLLGGVDFRLALGISLCVGFVTGLLDKILTTLRKIHESIAKRSNTPD